MHFSTRVRTWLAARLYRVQYSTAPGGCFMPRQTGRLTVGRKMRLRLSLAQFCTGEYEEKT
jgi:hypothetical protein